jgi:predicted nuclease of predicted toxin-antitoxin system
LHTRCLWLRCGNASATGVERHCGSAIFNVEKMIHFSSFHMSSLFTRSFFKCLA